MKLQTRFVQLPVQFDAALLAKEIADVGEEAWRPHPEGFAGNDFLPLISAYGDPANEAFEGPMQPTPHLERLSYMRDVLASFGATLGRTRLMRLAGEAEVTPHVDINYYWRDRMRVHVPIVTQPTVAFHCGDEVLNMKAGECWIFDTWSLHRVINDAVQSRIHLVADTVGGQGFWNHAVGGRSPAHPSPPDWQARMVAPTGRKDQKFDLETVNVPKVMTPWECADHINFLLGDVDPNHPAVMNVFQSTSRFLHCWKGAWSAYGENTEGFPVYRQILDAFTGDLRAARADTITMRNRANFMAALGNIVISHALADRRRAATGEQRDDPTKGAAAPKRTAMAGRDPEFDRPVFIVNPPRTGSSLLFETLTHAPDLYTIGGESHGLIEGIEPLSMPVRGWDSNRYTAADATPAVIAELRARFANNLRDRNGQPPRERPVRMLEKTPKNALRIPFLAAAFPEARFLYLHRDPREVLASMMEAWESGRFRTYPTMPDWNGERPWSLLLIPGWRDLASLPLNERVAAQWKTTMEILLGDFEQIPADRRATTRYEDLLADPEKEVRRICAQFDLQWDRALGKELPLSSHTVSKPKAEKWRAREGEIEAVLPALRPLMDRAAAFTSK